MSRQILSTGARACYDAEGRTIPCRGSLQDAALWIGASAPEPRFAQTDEGIADRLTGLLWYPEPDLADRPTDWDQALLQVRELNRSSSRTWHLPNINELESLVDASRHTPALPRDHPFSRTEEVYWSSTTSGFERDWAYALYLHKGAVGVGHKTHTGFAVWPVADTTQE